METNCFDCAYFEVDFDRENRQVVASCGMSMWNNHLYWPSWNRVSSEVGLHGDCEYFEDFEEPEGFH